MAGLLPQDHTTQDVPLKGFGTVYASPFVCKSKTSKDIKLYLLLLTCTLRRPIHLDILQNQTENKFLQALKRLIASRDSSRVIRCAKISYDKDFQIHFQSRSLVGQTVQTYVQSCKVMLI